jgi:hypothetical protein
MTLRSRQDAALAPVREALSSQASEQATRSLARASQAATALLAKAGHDADAAVAQATADGTAQARLVATAELSRSRQAARSIRLEAEQVTHQYLAGRIRSAVLALRDQGDYQLLRDRLNEMARRAAGPGAAITEHPDGGVIARARGVVVDCSLGRLADRAIAALEPRIAALCVGSQPPYGQEESR